MRELQNWPLVVMLSRKHSIFNHRPWNSVFSYLQCWYGDDWKLSGIFNYIVALRWGRLGGWGAERENKKGCTVFWYTPNEAKVFVKPYLTDGAITKITGVRDDASVVDTSTDSEAPHTDAMTVPSGRNVHAN